MELRPLIKIEPCIFCGGDPKIFIDGDGISTENVNAFHLEIICDCGAKLVGGEEIISEWNRRAKNGKIGGERGSRNRPDLALKAWKRRNDL